MDHFRTMRGGRRSRWATLSCWPAHDKTIHSACGHLVHFREYCAPFVFFVPLLAVPLCFHCWFALVVAALALGPQIQTKSAIKIIWRPNAQDNGQRLSKSLKWAVALDCVHSISFRTNQIDSNTSVLCSNSRFVFHPRQNLGQKHWPTSGRGRR